MNSSNLSRARGGSSRCDFVGVEPRCLVSPAPSRRPSQMAGINVALQELVDELVNRERPMLEIDYENPSLLCSTSDSPVSCIEIERGDEEIEDTDVILVLFPWMQVSVICSIGIKLARLKAELFLRLEKMKVANFSMEASDYVFRAMRSTTGEMELLYNEECELYNLDLTLPFPMLFLHEPEGARHEKELAKNIARALGYSLDSLEQNLSDELKFARAAFWDVTNDSVQSRGSGGYSHYAFSEETILDLEDECPQQLLAKIHASKLCHEVFYRSLANEEKNVDEGGIRVSIPFEDDLTPTLLVQRALKQLSAAGHNPDKDEYLLQLAGRKSYLTRNDRRLVAYSSVRSCLSNYSNPIFVLRRKNIVLRDYPKCRPLPKPYYVHAEESRLKMLSKDKDPLPSLWSVDENMLVRPVSYSNMGAHHDYNSTVVLTFTWYMGPAVIASVASREICPRNPRWFDSSIYTGIYMKDVPESLILCIQLFEVKREKTKKDKESGKRDSESDKDGETRDKKENVHTSDKKDGAFKGWPDFLRLLKEREEEGAKKKTKDRDEKISISPIGWANLAMFDWRGDMQLGTFTVSLWPGEAELPPLGRMGQNEIRLDENGRQVSPCRVTFDVMTTVSSRETTRRQCRLVDDRRWAELYEASGRRFPSTVPRHLAENDAELIKLRSLLNIRLLGGTLSEEEQEYAWKHRYHISRFVPDALLLVAETRQMWEKRDSFGEMYTILFAQRDSCCAWQQLSVGTAITILSCKNTDRQIRKFAVEQLNEALDNHNFPLFILPLIQALKCEMWAYSDLACLLLRRALADYRIGHKLFWLLRAELIGIRDTLGENSELYKRVALIIEAYLRGNDDHITTIIKQVEMVEFLSDLTGIIKGYRDKNSATNRLRDELRDKCTVIENIDSPLDPTNVLGELIIDKCKVLGSAKMPLRLSWRNVNPFSQYHLPTYEIIFKNGDDLRQDMLVLQVLEVMNSVWKRNQLDCCLSPYPVLPTGTKVGMIGVVPNCCTIFEIQSEGGKMGTAVKSLETTFINKYIRSHAGASKRYLECVDRFLMSCVGYSVATFIMGIKDRHNDNIMMTEDGKLFHIDFGHILGHGKTKLGIQRDRVPFVLTEHFLCVIGKGKPVSRDSHDVTKFRQLSIDAYLMLWDVRFLFLSLFAAMQPMELPELSTDADLDHLKRTLRVDVDDDSRSAAGQYFSDIFDEAFNGSWSTKTNWFFHTVKHL